MGVNFAKTDILVWDVVVIGREVVSVVVYPGTGWCGGVPGYGVYGDGRVVVPHRGTGPGPVLHCTTASPPLYHC